MRRSARRPGCHVEPIEKSVDRARLERGERLLLAVTGMGCINCANRVRNALLVLDGVLAVRIFLETARAEVVLDPGVVGVPELLSAVAGAGATTGHRYRAAPLRRP